MPQSITQKVVNQFNKGLITEAGEFTFPQDASVDELNCQLNRDGSRRRREGIKFEDNPSVSDDVLNETDIVTTGTWKNVRGVAEREVLVVQFGNTLYFYDKLEQPYSAQQIDTQVSLTTFEYTGGPSSSDFKCQFTSINSELIVTSPAIRPIKIFLADKIFGVGEAAFASEIEFKVRDFGYQSDRDELNEPIPTGSVTDERIYDTQNSGWVDDKGSAALSTYIASESEYPALNLPWYAGKDSSGNFSVAEWQKIYSGTSVTTNGHYILDFFNKDRATASGIVGLPVENEESSFRTVEAFASRVFYAGLNSRANGSTILFSRLLETNAGLGDCYQINDPTSEDLSDLLDTDGGVIRIPDAIGITKLHSYNNSLFVFAENGIWRIKGVDDVFRATEYSVTRISEVGLRNPDSFVSVEGVPFWWADNGIYTLTPDQAGFNFREQNLTITTIQTFYENINSTAKSRTQGYYDPVNQRIFWLYPDNGETIINKLNNILILDIPLQAFYPWRVSDQDANTDYIVGAAYYRGYGSEVSEVDVYSDGDQVVSDGDDVVSERSLTIDTGEPRLVFLCRVDAVQKMTMATFSNEEFLDWESANYSSYMEGGYDFMGDAMFQKHAPYIQVYARTTETGWTGDESTGYDLVRPSSLLVSSYWDFATGPSTPAQQAYRLKPMPIVDTGSLNSFNYPTTVVDTRLKIRGKGKSMRLRFESEEGKDFVLLGYGIIHARNRRY